MARVLFFLVFFSLTLFAQYEEFETVPLGSVPKDAEVEEFAPAPVVDPAGGGMSPSALDRLSRRSLTGPTDTGMRMIPFVTSRPIYRDDNGKIKVFNDPNRQRPADKFFTGYAKVYFPKEIHKRGQVERKGEDKNVFRIVDVGLENRNTFTNQALGPRKPQLLIYVHGFNNNFLDSIFQTAQLSEDLGFAKAFDNKMIAYSWVSGGLVINYLQDREFLDIEGQRLYEYLSLLIKNRPDADINLLAHSMGNEVALRALNLLYEEVKNNPKKGVLKTIILAAPDVDAAVFTSYMPRVTTLARKVTHYFSTKDIPIRLSPYVNPGKLRAGRTAIYHSKLDSIDVDEVNSKEIGLGHSYFAATDYVLNDINNIVFSLFGDTFLPEMRDASKWQKVVDDKGTHWKMLKR